LIPQQSLLLTQRSPMILQPVSCWQMPTPEIGSGAHERLQHPAPVHVPSGEQTSPAGLQLPPTTVTPVRLLHRPKVAPAAFLQTPPQHCASAMQTSPTCVQNDDAPPQMPPLQSPPRHAP